MKNILIHPLIHSRAVSRTLGFRLGLVIVLKIVFLIALWNIVLSQQITHVGERDMTEKFLNQPPLQK